MAWWYSTSPACLNGTDRCSRLVEGWVHAELRHQGCVPFWGDFLTSWILEMSQPVEQIHQTEITPLNKCNEYKLYGQNYLKYVVLPKCFTKYNCTIMCVFVCCSITFSLWGLAQSWSCMKCPMDKTRSMKTRFADTFIGELKSSAQSNDLNPIEHHLQISTLLH